ncbi:Ankyrin repeat domain-containing 50-like protein [Cladobotryum mycophilum]|uniref:Ankyrin repeat domain-containing 50-like protein n=1 Tax=Cladobotryum mycophilum TaxID=491253 RepID=A0ABR0SRB7_9HYPO
MAQHQIDLLNQNHNIGITQGINYGDNNIYNYYTDRSSSSLRLTPSQYTRQTHEKWRAVWKDTGTCEWLLKRTEFSEWLQMDDKNSFLWIHGLQGCGKTTLMSRAIECIREERIDVKRLRDAHLLYFYIGYGNDKETQQFYRDMLMTFWEQMIAKDGTRASDLFGTSTSDEEIHEKLNSHLASSQRDVYIAIDALDQLPLQEQRKLLNGLDALFQKHKAGQSNFRIAAIISSRDRTGFDRLQTHKLCEIHIKPSDSADDIRNYLKKNLNSYLFDDQPALRERVLSGLIRKADGMFLWAKLQRANICDMEMEEDVEYALQTLLPPGKMHQIYQDYAARFESLERPTEKQIALRAMALLAYTAELVPKEVLLVALALDIKNGKPNPKTYKELSEEPAKVVRICHHLIEMNENLGVFRFCHGSVYEFFRHYQPATSHGRIAELCLAHICASDFSQVPHSSAEWYNYGSLGPVLREHKFLEFASCNWAISMKQSIERNGDGTSIKTTHETILALLQKLSGTAEAKEEKQNLQLSFQVYLLSMRKSKPMPGGVCLEHIISYFALFAFFNVFHQRRWLDLEKRDHEGSTSIHWAIRNQTEKDTTHVIGILIAYGSDVNAQDAEGRTPLYYAAHYGRFDVVRLLLDRGANLDIQSRAGETALIAACKEHHEEIVLELVEAGADVQVQGPLGTALQAVSLIGCDRCVERILDRYGTKSTITETNGPYGTSLHAAAFHGHHKVVQLLLRTNKFDVRTRNETYGNILTAAASGCARTLDSTPFHNIFEQAIAQGADTNDTSGFFGPPLRAAAANGHSTLVRILLDNGAKVSTAQGLMGTAYFAADIQEYEEIRQLLMQSDPNAAIYGSVDSKNTLSILHDVWRKMFGVAMAAGNVAILNGVIGQVEGLLKKTIQIENIPIVRMMVYVGAGFFNDVVKLATSSGSETEAYEIDNILREGAIAEELEEKGGLSSLD